MDNCTGCVPLNLTYNPNNEGPQIKFYCDEPLNWGETDNQGEPLNPVKIDTNNRCHLFCDRVSNSMFEGRMGLKSDFKARTVSMLCIVVIRQIQGHFGQ